MPPTALRFALAAAGIGGSLALTMCGNGGTTTTSTGSSCPNGICGPATGTGGGTASSSGAGGSSTTGSGMGGMTTTTSSSGTMTSSSSGGMSTSASSSATSSSGSTCVPSWLCTPWDTNVQPAGASNMGHRTCTDTKNCNTTVGMPVTTATLPALDVDAFKCNVEPILDKKCGMLGCHGTETGRALRVYAKARLRHAGENLTLPAICPSSATSASCIGSNSCPCNARHTPTEWQRNYDAARGFALDDMGNVLANQSASDLIQQPVVGGKSHAGIHLFKPNDPEDAAILSWLNNVPLGMTCNVGFN